MADETEVFTFMDVQESGKLNRDGEPMYSLGNQKPIAYCCVIANSGENTNRPIRNTANDLQYVATAFTTVGAKIVLQNRYKGMQYQDVHSLLNTLKAMDLKSCPCFIFYYSGHGKDCGIQLDENRTFSFRIIVDTITSLPDLAGKPKVFIFDCCKVYSSQPECRKNCKTESYTDCLIAYACSDGEQAYISSSPYMKNNSIFTKAFCMMLMANHRQWSLVSILIHASSLTNKSMDEYYRQTQLMVGQEVMSPQTPHVIVKLRKQLYLCFDRFVERKDSVNIMDYELYADMDYIHDGVPTKRLQFNSKEDVTQNLGSLGQRLKIFICYAPSISSKETKGKLESRIYSFARHLITYGFDVRVDLFASFTVGFDWASWTDREMSQADWIIFVNSKSSYELLYHPNSPKDVEITVPHVSNSFDRVISEATKKIKFSGRALYNRLYHDTTLKIIPVVLQEEDNKIEYILPILRDVNSVLHIYEDTPFDYDRLEGHFERLVCRMAGINRMDINSRGVKQEFIKLPSKIPQNPVQMHSQAVAQEVTSQAPRHSTYRQIPSVSQTHSYQTLPQQHYHHNSHPHGAMFIGVMPETTIPPAIHQQPQIPFGHPHFTQAQYSHYSKHTAHSSNQYNNSYNEISQPVHMHNGTNHYLTPQRNIPRAPPKVTSDELPSHKVPADSPILWKLSLDVREWKFLARFLDLEEEVIEEIDQYTRPNKTRDKSLKMLTEWVNTSSDATWKVLGEAILDTENTLLYEKLVELIKSYAI